MASQDSDAVFCIDSSSFIYLHRFYPPDFCKDVWDEFEALFHDGRIISHVIVFEELTTSAKRPDSLTKWIQSKKQYFRGFTATQARHVAEIIRQFPGLIDPQREKDEADPWLIALAIEEQAQVQLFGPRRIIVVSEEGKNKPQKMPAVCRHFGLDHLTLLEFYKYHGWDFVIRKTR